MFTVYLSFHVCHVTFYTSVSVLIWVDICHAEAIECVALATASSEDVLVCVLSWRLTAVSSEMQRGGRWFLMRLTDIKPHFQMHCKDSWNSWALTPGVSVCGGFRAAACGEAANISHHTGWKCLFGHTELHEDDCEQKQSIVGTDVAWWNVKPCKIRNTMVLSGSFYSFTETNINVYK